MKIPFVTNFLKRRQAKLNEERFRRGYDLAAGLCLLGCTEEDIQAMKDHNPNEFDKGMDAAVKDFFNLLKTKS